MPLRHMTATAISAALLLACSRQAAEPPNAAPATTPASGEPAPLARSHPRCSQNFQAFDDDADGRVSKDEFDDRPHAHHDPAAVFRDRDRDGDGSLTEVEFCSGFRGPRSDPAQDPRPGAAPGRRGAGMRHGGPPGTMRGARCEQHFETFDANRDGKLTKAEFAAWPHVHGDADVLFDERDGDHDGTVTLGEFCSSSAGVPAPASPTD